MYPNKKDIEIIDSELKITNRLPIGTYVEFNGEIEKQKAPIEITRPTYDNCNDDWDYYDKKIHVLKYTDGTQKGVICGAYKRCSGKVDSQFVYLHDKTIEVYGIKQGYCNKPILILPEHIVRIIDEVPQLQFRSPGYYMRSDIIRTI